MLKPQDDWMLLEEMPKIAGPGEIILPDSHDEKTILPGYRVLSVGPGYKEGTEFRTPTAKKGDLVVMDGPTVAKFMYQGKHVIAAMARYVAFIDAVE